MNRDLAVLGATKSLQNARGLLEDSKLLFKRERYGTSYALAIYALEEAAKGFIFHWVADGNLTEADLRKLIYDHRRKHATVQLVGFFEKATPYMLPMFEAWFGGDSKNLKLSVDELKKIFETAQKESSQQVHLLIHAKQRREVSLYVGICDRCNEELLGPWLITASETNELLRYTEEHLGKIESLVRNCKKHESDIEIEFNIEREGKQIQIQDSFRRLVRSTVESLDRASKIQCKHVLCSHIRRPPPITQGRIA
jgi:AbiV family abortive infection protein